jgi:heat shock protein HtpX
MRDGQGGFMNANGLKTALLLGGLTGILLLIGYAVGGEAGLVMGFGLASALEKLETYSRQVPLRVNPAVSHLFIVAPLTGVSLQRLFRTHPPTAERVTRLRRMAGLVRQAASR